MKEVRFLEEALEEFLEQVAYYEEREKGLGERFRLAVQAATTLAATVELVAGVFQHIGQRCAQHLGALAEHQREVRQHGPDAIDAGRAERHLQCSNKADYHARHRAHH